MELFVLRHGEAGKRSASGSKDFARPLTVTGQKEVADIAASLKDLGIKFDLIITSPLKRAHQTAARRPTFRVGRRRTVSLHLSRERVR